MVCRGPYRNFDLFNIVFPPPLYRENRNVTRDGHIMLMITRKITSVQIKCCALLRSSL